MRSMLKTGIFVLMLAARCRSRLRPERWKASPSVRAPAPSLPGLSARSPAALSAVWSADRTSSITGIVTAGSTITAIVIADGAERPIGVRAVATRSGRLPLRVSLHRNQT